MISDSIGQNRLGNTLYNFERQKWLSLRSLKAISIPIVSHIARLMKRRKLRNHFILPLLKKLIFMQHVRPLNRRFGKIVKWM